MNIGVSDIWGDIDDCKDSDIIGVTVGIEDIVIVFIDVFVFDCSDDEEWLINDDGDNVVFAVVVFELVNDWLELDERVVVLEFEEDALIDEDKVDVFVFVVLAVWDTDILDVFEFIELSEDDNELDGSNEYDIDALDDIDSVFILVIDTCGVTELLDVIEALEDIDGDPESL